jgi:nucleotidyltransferase substrate binding protein (TIGR01987 family)
MGKDIRWQQRLTNYSKALRQLEKAVNEARDGRLSELEKQGLIQAFEFTHELAWNVMKDYFRYQGNTSVHGSRDATREAFSNGLINNGDTWMEMILSRNETSHTYNEGTVEEIFSLIVEKYYKAFVDFERTMKEIKSKEEGS